MNNRRVTSKHQSSSSKLEDAEVTPMKKLQNNKGIHFRSH
ncbi:hypothetical protein JOC48_001551 [Aquibacillus albus]|uniref:Uncharacterized protein n=1 Tax=Aquibacillus albus TaxID=1168171 RepID=A0ABS2MZ41_9BACI|nr:hypothetical protein [Aquibacillus albus]